MANQLFRAGFNFYQNANADAESVKDNFLIRLHEYEIIIDDIRRNKMKGSVQHYLLLGRRGSGKSTLLKRLQVEIETDKKLTKSYIAINLAEEQANIYKLYDLLGEILEELKVHINYIKEPDWEEDEQIYSRNLFATIHQVIEKSGKKVILLLDNIDRIFENLGDDASLLREYLLNYDDIKVIGGSTKMTEHFWKYNQPFYEFFRVLELKPLSNDEIRRLLLNWSEKLDIPDLKTFVENKPGQLETIRILTDGLPRTLQFFVDILLTNTQETGYEYLRLIMDKVTPLYQERLNNLPPAQRKIVLQMAFIWESAGAKEIAEATKMENRVISAQLKQLIDKGIADRIETSNKNNLYRLSERFFNLWLIFTQGSPREKRRAKYLTIFLENFYDENELKTLASNHLKEIDNWTLSEDRAVFWTKALSQSKFISFDTRDRLIEKTLLLQNISDELKNQLPLTTIQIINEVNAELQNNNFGGALQLLNSIEQEYAGKSCLIASIFLSMDDYKNTILHYLKAIDEGAVEESLDKIFFLLGCSYENMQKYKEAEKYYLQAIDKGYNNAFLALGNLYKNLNEIELCEKYFLKAKDHGSEVAKLELAFLYYCNNLKKKDSLSLINDYHDEDGDFFPFVLLIRIWNGAFPDNLENKILGILEKDYEYTGIILKSMLMHKQINLVKNIFAKENINKIIQERYLPLYHALQILLNNEPNALIKVPAEILDTVNGVLKQIEKVREFYYGS
jgi:tetratricopeptide (TPR) repeat protein/energy-coupling factor transporter ATP-binding protein EcfA2